MCVCCVCYVLSGRGLCDQLITRAEESYRLWRVVCVHETSCDEEVIAHAGLQCQRNKQWIIININFHFPSRDSHDANLEFIH
jgi:hypothetical protein